VFGIPEWAIGVGFILLIVSLGKALTGRTSGGLRHLRRASLRGLEPDLEEIEQGQRRLGEGGDLQGRLSEVEERLDFVERMLAKQRDAERVTPPKN
jgi:hypothetical protein